MALILLTLQREYARASYAFVLVRSGSADASYGPSCTVLALRSVVEDPALSADVRLHARGLFRSAMEARLAAYEQAESGHFMPDHPLLRLFGLRRVHRDVLLEMELSTFRALGIQEPFSVSGVSQWLEANDANLDSGQAAQPFAQMHDEFVKALRHYETFHRQHTTVKAVPK